MDTSPHDMNTLFQQLGLDSTPQGIELFIHSHSPIDNNTLIEQAAFWTASQADFLKEAKNDDADWSEIVDLLDARMRK